MGINEITGLVIDSAMKVHSALGAGLLEHPYKVCLRHELNRRGVDTVSEVVLPIVYDSVVVDLGYRLDLLVGGEVVVEIKSVGHFAGIHKAQLLTYLKLAKKPVGLLINFNTPHLRNGILRLINSSASSASSAVNLKEELQLPVTPPTTAM